MLAYLFGSMARGETGPLSDFDIGILFSEKLSEKKYLDYELFFRREFARFLKTDDIDLVLLNEANSTLCMSVIREGKVLFMKNKVEKTAFETAVMQQYLDRIPHEEMFLRSLLARYS